MTIKTELDVADLQRRVRALEGTPTPADDDVMSITREQWQALLQRVEALEKGRKKP